MAFVEDYFDCLNKQLSVREVHCELGRSLVANCGTLFTGVLYVKNDFLIVDTGMNDFIRPALYGARHVIENITNNLGNREYEVVGGICETTDSFGKHVLPVTGVGDILAIRSV